jgi:hypothetical protein
VLYRALLIGTDLAAATRPLHWKDTGNPTRDLVAEPTRGVVPGMGLIYCRVPRVRD